MFKKEVKIKILKDGPYLVSGGIPLYHKTIVPKGECYTYVNEKKFDEKNTYTLCRCGKSNKSPYCDGSHIGAGFKGDETASKDKYIERARVIEGPEIDLYDDNRCALAMFCHRDAGDAWELTEDSSSENNKEEAIIAAVECPSGRLTAKEKKGSFIEPEYKPAIDILNGPVSGISGAIAVKGNISLESSDGEEYEVRNRYTLCRCGNSDNKPFCDGTHIDIEYEEKCN